MTNEYKLICVNKDHPLNEEIAIDLVKTPSSFSSGYFLINKEVLQAFLELRNESLMMGIDLVIDRGYRSIDNQQIIFDLASELKGLEYAYNNIELPGESEHHTGLAIDLTLRINDRLLEEDKELFDHDYLFRIIHNILPNYGFILRYPENKIDITGHEYKPWHIRYIGKENAMDMKEKGITTLEEYLSIKRTRKNNSD